MSVLVDEHKPNEDGFLHTFAEDFSENNKTEDAFEYKNNPIWFNEMIEAYNDVWKCTMCGKMSKRKSDLRKHTETHMVGMSHNCSTCGKTYRSKNWPRRLACAMRACVRHA